MVGRSLGWLGVVVGLFLGSVPLGIAGCSEDKDPNVSPTPSTPSTPGDEAGTATPDGGSGPKLDSLGPEFVDLGQVGPEFDLDVPEGTLGFSFTTEDVPVLSVRDAAGKTYLAEEAPAGLGIDYAELTRFPSLSGRMDVPPGKWHVAMAQASTVKVSRQRTSDGKFHGGVLDLYVYLPAGVHAEDVMSGVKPGEVVSAANAGANPVMGSIVSTLFTQIKRLYDFDRGEVKFIDVAATYLSIPDEPASRVAAAIGARSAKDQLGLHLLFTEQIFGGDAKGVAAATSGIDFDRKLNAVIVDIRDIEAPGATKGSLEAAGFGVAGLPVFSAIHEMGHLLGLAHSSDLAITPYDDGFSGTSTCPVDTIATSRNLCPDLKNLMFPAIDTPIAQTTLTDEQRTVVRGTTIYKPYGP